MKNRFTTVDIFACINELNETLKGSRIGNVYDVSHRTYLMKFSKDEIKRTLLLESGIRIHLTTFDWPKSPAPSSFAMKLRKHIRNKILLGVEQLGVDRIVDLQFGYNPVCPAYHVIVELYDKGNIFLCDKDYVILNALRPRTDAENSDVKYIVGQKYPVEMARKDSEPICDERLQELISSCKPSDPLKRLLIPNTLYGPALIDHALRSVGMAPSAKLSAIPQDEVLSIIRKVVDSAQQLFENLRACQSYRGYITVKKETSDINGEVKTVENFTDFNPFTFLQLNPDELQTYNSFNEAVDSYFSLMEAQRIDAKQLQQEKQVMKKLQNVKKDHESRIKALEKAQVSNARKAELITLNLETVEKALSVLRSALANQMSWQEIEEIVEQARSQGDPVASRITKLKFEHNKFEMRLSQVYSDDEEDDYSDEETDADSMKDAIVEIDISKSAFANSRLYYDNKKAATAKSQKTIEASAKAFENAEKVTQQNLKQLDVKCRIEKLRKIYWWEKFLWFISSDNLIVIGGHDQQQNELLVKKYLNRGDIYVHADMHGATSVIVKQAVDAVDENSVPPPRTLQEAASMAVCYSSAWEAKMWTSAWWVRHHQVSKTAPTGEYLTTGSFMIRGKKNPIVQPQLVMGFGFLFRLEESSIDRHRGERGIKGLRNGDDEAAVVTRQQSLPGAVSQFTSADHHDHDEEIDTLDGVPEHQSGDKEKMTSNLQEENDENTEPPNGEVVAEAENMPRADDSTNVTDANIIEKKGSEIPCQPLSEEVKEPDSSSEESEHNSKQNHEQQKLKRGQKKKMKKILMKYADQDEDERAERMALLGSAGQPKEKKKARQKQQQLQAAAGRRVPQKQKHTQPMAQLVFVPDDSGDGPNGETSAASTEVKSQEKPVERDDDDDVGPLNSTDLDELTGCPVEEDELLFALPVCAPYSAIVNYKYKVKVVPGTSKRGKAVKTALHMFAQNKDAAPYEKTLMTAVKDGDLTRNMPGNVKLSAPNLSKIKHK